MRMEKYIQLKLLIAEHGEKAFDEEQYESIYEVIRPPESESDFEEIPEEEVILYSGSFTY